VGEKENSGACVAEEEKICLRNHKRIFLNKPLAKVALCARRDVRSASFPSSGHVEEAQSGGKDALRTSLRAHRATFARGLIILRHPLGK